MPLISHRGAAGLAPANSREAILRGDSYRPEYIEIDINLTSDGKLIVFHGAIHRFLSGMPTDKTYKELINRDDAENLQDVLDVPTNSPFMFDIKCSDYTAIDYLCSQITKSRCQDFAFTSPHPDALTQLKKAFPDAFVFQNQPYHHGPFNALAIAEGRKFDGIAINKWWISPLLVWLCAVRNKKLMVYTVDSRLFIRLLKKLYPSVYIVTNFPDRY